MGSLSNLKVVLCTRRSASADDADEPLLTGLVRRVSDEVVLSPEEVVQAEVEAYNALDAEALTKCFHSEAVVIGPDGQVMMAGSDAIKGMYAQLFAQSPDLHVDIISRITVGDWVIDEEATSGLVFEGFPPDLHAAVVYQVRDQLITQVRILA